MINKDLKNFRLQYARWEDLPPDVQETFTSMMGGDPVEGSDFYRLYFYWYNIAHEVGHILRNLYLTSTISTWNEENAVNQFAVAFWRAKGETERLLTLEMLLRKALTHLPDPVPAQEDRATYLNNHIQAVSNEPAAYSHYQFNMVRSAMAHPIEFSQAIKTLISFDANDGATIPLQPDFPLDDELPHRTVHDLRRTLAAYGLKLPDIQIICFYTPALQFAEWDR
jgi:hypothetical protein